MIFNPVVLDQGRLKRYGESVKGSFHMSALYAYDKITAITYLNPGTRTQMINTITYTSALYPDSDVVKTFFYLDVGSINQRIDKIEYVGSVFSPDSLRQVFTYSLSGIKYKLDGFNWELF